MESIKEILVSRDGITPQEAEEYIQSVAEEFRVSVEENDFDMAQDILQDSFSLEPDFIPDMLRYV
jgi:uncharacterized protein YpuA (DUF1002 family)